MEAVRVVRTGLPDLQFEGECIVESRGDDTDGTTGNRWHDVIVYRASDGEYIVSIIYRTVHPDESPDAFVETASSLEDVEGALSLYDPIERVNHEAIAVQRMPVQAVLRVITRRYDLQVNEILERLQKASSPV